MCLNIMKKKTFSVIVIDILKRLSNKTAINYNN